MKFLLFATALSLFSSVMLPARADSPSSSAPASTPPSIPPVSVDARDLTGEAIGVDPVQPPDRSQQLSEQAQQINRRLGTRRQPPPPQLEQLSEMLDLPDGMVIRGGSRGGVGVGREF